ncbi:ABC transporter ATP-binding protein [Pararobbsia silviterrae]|uniref:ABC transporter ATP-binding protein n=1 Tax=Pararobbsia silviterrae TaxID=1792498 RepID=A0A494XJ44_9BURK|nr:ABC transporter ATP-binding protein [Pararobbsia silviterrae]
MANATTNATTNATSDATVVSTSTASPPPLLAADDLRAGYGDVEVLRGVALDVRRGEIVAMLGRNGAGRSTLAKALMGLVARTGSVRVDGVETVHWRTDTLARHGVAYVAETRDVFPTLTVRQNLLLGLRPGRTFGEVCEPMLARLPALARRLGTRAGVLSGGEQQMLAIARALAGEPALVILDEPTEGLAPSMVEQIADWLATLAADGLGVLLIEQKLSIALRLAARVYLMGRGKIAFAGTPGELVERQETLRHWLEW